MSNVLQASISILGYGYRAFIDHGLSNYQIKTWLCAYPIVLFMAPFGAYALSRLHVNWMLKAIIVINIFQLIYFNCTDPSIEKLFCVGHFFHPTCIDLCPRASPYDQQEPQPGQCSLTLPTVGSRLGALAKSRAIRPLQRV
jgi:hypothetical protein